LKYDVVQQSIEEFVQDNWSHTAVAYENVEFDSEPVSEYVRCNVVFGEGLSRTVTVGCYRQTGLLLLSIFVRPSTGTSRKLALAALASDLVKSVIVQPTPPLVAPAVNLKVPSLFNDPKERDGWVQAQVSCPFYYDI
jgi:hypothetical protein